MSLVAEVPGVVYAPDGRGVLCTWDAVPAVAPYVGKSVPSLPLTPLESLPGYAAYLEVLERNNIDPYPHQVSGAEFLANRAYGFLCHPMRAGKTLTTLLAAKLAGHRRILVLCPPISKWVWGDEVSKWLGTEALILSGLSRSRALRYCSVCKLSGRMPDGRRCPACRQRNGSTYGYHIIGVQETVEPTKRARDQGLVLHRCRKHPEVRSRPDEELRCPDCRAELREALLTSEVIVGNYDILFGRGYRTLTSRVEIREEYAGWSEPLSLLDFDLVILDESHYLRGFDTSYAKRGKMLSDRVQQMITHVPAAWLVTGTPIFGLVRDLYGQLSVATNGLYGDAREFTERYCGGHRGAYGWESKGRSNEEELKERLDVVMDIRQRSEIFKDMPQKQRRVLYIDNDKPIRRKISGGARGAVAKLIDAIAPKKHKAVVENVVPELAEGLKVYVLTYRPKHAERLANLLAKTMNSKQWRARMNMVRAEIFLGQNEAGISPRRRRQLAKSYVDHQGAAVFVATIGTMPASISLIGASMVHMADFDPSPSAMEQAEDRGYEPGTPGYSITHYVVRNSIDDDLAAVVIPKFETKDKLFNEENARNVLDAFNDDEETIEEVMRRHTAHLNEDDDEDDWM